VIGPVAISKRYGPGEAYELVRSSFEGFDPDDATLVHTGCKGWDALCVRVAFDLGMRIVCIRPADHSALDYGSLAYSDEIVDAPPGTSTHNNDYRMAYLEMVGMIDHLVAFWNRKHKRGRENMTINIARQKGVSVSIIEVDTRRK